MKPVTTETVKAEIERLESIQRSSFTMLSMKEEFYLNCLRHLLAALTPATN